MTQRHSHEGSSRLFVTVDRGDSQFVVHLVGELDLSSAPSVREVLSDALEENPVELVLDLADLNYVDSTGLSLFVGAKKRAQTSGTRLVLRNLQSGTQRLLEITGLKDSFDLDD